MTKSSFRGRKVAQIHVRDSQKFLHLILIGIQLKLFFEFCARLGITLFLKVLKIGVSEKAMSARIAGIKFDSLTKFRDSLLGDLGNEVGPAKHHVQRSRFSHRGLELVK